MTGIEKDLQALEFQLRQILSAEFTGIHSDRCEIAAHNQKLQYLSSALGSAAVAFFGFSIIDGIFKQPILESVPNQNYPDPAFLSIVLGLILAVAGYLILGDTRRNNSESL